MNFEKENFLRTRLVRYLQQLDPHTPPRWGKMNAQQMVEHFAGDAIRIASGALKMDKILTTPDQLSRMREFLRSDKPFKKNLKNPLLGEEPAPLHHKTMQAAIGYLQEQLIFFFEAFDNDPSLVTRNPFYGDLDFESNVQLLYKHAIHHLEQFGVVHLGKA